MDVVVNWKARGQASSLTIHPVMPLYKHVLNQKSMRWHHHEIGKHYFENVRNFSFIINRQKSSDTRTQGTLVMASLLEMQKVALVDFSVRRTTSGSDIMCSQRHAVLNHQNQEYIESSKPLI